MNTPLCPTQGAPQAVTRTISALASGLVRRRSTTASVAGAVPSLTFYNETCGSEEDADLAKAPDGEGTTDAASAAALIADESAGEGRIKCM